MDPDGRHGRDCGRPAFYSDQDHSQSGFGRLSDCRCHGSSIFPRDLLWADHDGSKLQVIGIVNVIVTTIAIHHGFGKHTTTIGTPAAEKANFTIAISWIFGILSFAVPKLAIAALLARILNPSFRMLCALWGLTGFVGAVAIVNILIFFTSCDPPRAVWEAVEGAVCRDPYILINYARFNGGGCLRLYNT